MPWAFIIVGALLCILAVKEDNSLHDFAETLSKDVSGNTGFVKWIVAIVVIGGIGYIPELQDMSTAFLVLLIISFLLSNSGVFAKAQKALQ